VLHPGRQAFVIFIENIQCCEDLSVIRSVVDKVIGPDVVAVFRAQSYSGPLIQLQPPLLGLVHGHFQPFTSPQALNALVIDQSTDVSKQRRDPSIPVPATLPCKFDHIRHRAVFVKPAPWLLQCGSLRQYLFEVSISWGMTTEDTQHHINTRRVDFRFLDVRNLNPDIYPGFVFH